MGPRSRLRVGVLGCLALAATSGPATASHTSPLGSTPGSSGSPPASFRKKPLRLHLQFRVTNADVGATNGRYVLVTGVGSPTYPPTPTSTFTLIDDHTGRQATLRNICANESIGFSPSFGGPFVLLAACSAAGRLYAELYRLQSGTYKIVSVNDPYCGGQSVPCVVEAVGARWLEFEEIYPYPTNPKLRFQNVHTGVVRGPPKTGPTTFEDLGSPTLTSKVCAPLRVPAGDSVTYYGNVALISPHAGYFQRCGSSVRLGPWTVYQEGEIQGTSHALLWLDLSTSLPRVAGVFLPSLRRFQAALPQGFSALSQGSRILLSDRALYLEGAASPTVIARFPRSPHR